MDQHLRYLDECAELHERTRKNAGRAGAPSDPLERICLLNPDMMLEIAKVRVWESWIGNENGAVGAGIAPCGSMARYTRRP